VRLDFCQAPEEMVSALGEIPQMQGRFLENIQVFSETLTFTCFSLANCLTRHSKILLREGGLVKAQDVLTLFPMSLPGRPGGNYNFDEQPKSNIDFHAKSKKGV